MSLRTYPFITHPAFLDYIGLDEAERAHIQDQHARRIPKIDRYTDIGQYLGVSAEIIRRLIVFQRVHYRSFEIKKRDGSLRTIDAPRTFMKVVQWWINDTIISCQEMPGCVFGFVKGRSFIDNAKAHVGGTHILNVDVANFFPSIGIGKVKSVFRDIGYSDDVSISLSTLTCYKGTLPQGAPTSPGIANCVFRKCDLQIIDLADRVAWSTRDTPTT